MFRISHLPNSDIRRSCYSHGISSLYSICILRCEVSTPADGSMPRSRTFANGLRRVLFSCCAAKSAARINQSRIDQHARIHQSLRIERALGAAQCLRKQLGALLVVERTMEAADGMMMRSGAAMRDSRCRA